MYTNLDVAAIILIAVIMLGPLTAGVFAPDMRGNNMIDLQEKHAPRK